MGRSTLSVTERFWKYVDVTGPCWLWTGGLRMGYGRFSKNGAIVSVHRESWEIHFGSIPVGQYVLHKCDVRNCVRPSHLFLGTYKDNAIDMVNKKRHWAQKKTHCKNEHPFIESNTYISVTNGQRVCRECQRQAKVRYRQRKAAA